MREVGVDIADRRPKKLTVEMQLHADFGITLACGASCPYVPTTGRGLQRGSIPANAVCRRDYSTETFRDFGAKVGLRRLLAICDKYDLKVSMPINGLTCEYYPELVKEAHQRGHEMIAHGWDQG